MSTQDRSDLDELEHQEAIRDTVDTSIAQSEHRMSTQEEYVEGKIDLECQVWETMFARCPGEPRGSCSSNENYDCDYCFDVYAGTERRRLDAVSETEAIRQLASDQMDSNIGDAHLTEDGGGAQGPSEPQCLARRTLGTWLPYRTSL